MSYSDETLRRPRKVAFYGRVSTELEAQTAALKSQMEWYHKLAAQYPNWSVVNQYADDGVTGTVKEVRRAFMKMLYDAKEGKFDLIVTREVSRFARNTVDTVAVNVKRMLELLKELPDQSLVFEVDDNNFEIHLQYHNGDYKFVGVDGNEYPRKEEEPEAKLEMIIPASEITKSIEKTIFAAGTDQLRPIMMGVLWDIKPEDIVFVASDTHKLVRYVNSRVQPGFEGSFILPTKPASILSSILSKEAGDVKVMIDSKSVSFETETYTVNCQFINGKYPNYNAAIPQSNPYELIVDRTLFLNAIRRVAVFATEGGLIQLEISDSKITIKSQDLEYSLSAKESLDCDYSGDVLTVGFNKDKLIEVVSNISSDNLILRLSAPGRPGLFIPIEQAEKEDWLALLMPMVVPNM